LLLSPLVLSMCLALLSHFFVDWIRWREGQRARKLRTRTDIFLGFIVAITVPRRNTMERTTSLRSSGPGSSPFLLPITKKYNNHNKTPTAQTSSSNLYPTEAYALNAETKYSIQPTEMPFNVTFGWLEVVGAGCGDGQGGESSLGEGKDDVGKGRRGRRWVCGLNVRVERQVFMLMWVEGKQVQSSEKPYLGAAHGIPPGVF